MSRLKYFLLFFIVIANVHMFAQLNSISGYIVDGETHEGIPNAQVYLIKLKVLKLTDSTGKFEFNDIPPGEYSLEINRIGFKSINQQVIVEESYNKEYYFHLYPIFIQSKTVIITGEHNNSRLDELNEDLALKGKELQRDLSLTLATSLKNEVGLSVRSMGPAPARPVIRGLSGDRILINEDGNNTNDLSATSSDHAVAVEPFTAERIEIIRGPKILLNTSTTIGGIINIIREDIPETKPYYLKGGGGILFESANKGLLSSLNIELPLGDFVFKGEGTYKKTQDMDTPSGIIKNSDTENYNYSTGFSFIQSWGFAGFSIREFNSDYGVPGGFVGAHPNGIDVSMFKRQINAKAVLFAETNFVEKFEFNFSRTYYHHIEYETKDLIGAEFSIYNINSNIDVVHKNLFGLTNGVFGLSLENKDFNVGGYVFTPKTNSTKLSAYIFESSTYNDLDLQFSGRYNYDLIKPYTDKPEAKIGFIRKREFHTYSLSASLLYQIGEYLYLGTNVSKSSRVPTIEELFSEGPHLAAYSYETGNPELKDEQGYGIDLFSYYKTNNFFANINFFYNNLSYYIIPRNTGKINYNTLLPVYSSMGVPALLFGIEFKTDYKLINHLLIGGSLTYTKGEFRDENKPLPMIPPLKSFLELKYQNENYVFGFNMEGAAAQYKVDVFESTTKGYIIFNSFAQYTFLTGSIIHNISVNAENIFNKEYRNHLSRIKSILPEAGRNFRVVYKVYF